MAKSKETKERKFDISEIFPQPENRIIIPRKEVQPRPELGSFVGRIWDLRSDWIMFNMRGYPSIIIISRKLEHDMYMYFTSRPIDDSIAMEFLGHKSCGPTERRKIFGMRVIASDDVREGEIIIK